MSLTFRIRPRLIVRVLTVAAIALVVLSTAGQVVKHGLGVERFAGVIRFVHVDAERNLPTYFSAHLLLFAAGLLAFIACWHQQRREPDVRHWAVLAGGFALMAFDELISLHERLIAPTRVLLGGKDLGVFYFAWVLPAFAIVAVIALFYVRFWLRLPPPTRGRTLLAAGLYLGGCIGCELLGGRYAELHGQANLTYVDITTLEELLEMAGALVFIDTLLHYLAARVERLEFVITPPTAKSA